MKKKYIYLFIAILCNCTVLRILGADNVPFIPQLTPPSPDAAALGKYGQYPVSMCNGLVEIDIPIHTVELPLFKLPISISYHASGIKVDDISSTVGLGWVLNAGGVITRSVRGIPDANFGSNGTIQNKQWVNNTLRSEDDRLAHLDMWYRYDQRGGIDTESDVYYYNVCGLTGSFRFDIAGNLIQIPLTNNRIEFNTGTNTFRITGNDGTVYVFSDKERSRHLTATASTIFYTSSWYLSWIMTTDGREIDFDYTVDNTVYTEHTVGYWTKMPHLQPGSAQVNPSVSYSIIDNTILLNSITSCDGAVRFTYNGDRLDRRKYRLAGITVKNNNNQIVKAFSLEHGYFTTTGMLQGSSNYSSNFNNRLKLNKLLLLNSQGVSMENYQFDYNTSVSFPAYFNSLYPGIPTVGTNAAYFGQDKWGYYNGITTNTHLFVYNKVQSYPYSITVSSANRSVNPFYAQVGILKKITYPTGGYTLFEYEGNQYSQGEYAGGLRIKNVVSCSGVNSDSTVRSYQYGNGIRNYTGWADPSGNPYTQGETEITIEIGVIIETMKLYDHYSSHPGFSLSHTSGASVFYPNVIEYEGYPENSNGKTEHWFFYTSNDVEYFPQSPDSIGYVMIQSSSGRFLPRFEYLYIDRGWTRGYPFQTYVYKKNNGIFNLVKRTDYSYEIFKKQTKTVGFKSFASFNSANRWLAPPYRGSILNANKLFQYTDIIAETGLVKLTQVKDTSYYDGGAVGKLTTHFYAHLDNQYEVSATHEKNSDGSVLKKNFTYPKDINITIYKSMCILNMLSPVIVTIDSVDNRFLQKVQTSYSSWNNSFIAPSGITRKRGLEDEMSTVVYHSYDSKGNPLYISKNDAEHTVYLWSYNYQYPVIEVKGATLDEVKLAFNYTSNSQFESFASLQLPTESQVNTVGSTLRNYFQGRSVFVTTYTYKPLVGMTSATDPHGVTVFYEYDNFGRLKTIKDNNGNIIEKYDYHYKN